MAKKAAPTPDEGLTDMTAQRDAAYVERNRCVVAIARAALALGLRAWLGKHIDAPDAEPGSWDPEWLNVVFINLPAGLVSWHLHDSELPAFEFLRDMPPLLAYDGHSTPEKWERLAAWEPKRP
jgi:hypothetical protein